MTSAPQAASSTNSPSPAAGPHSPNVGEAVPTQAHQGLTQNFTTIANASHARQLIWVQGDGTAMKRFERADPWHAGEDARVPIPQRRYFDEETAMESRFGLTTEAAGAQAK